MFIQVHAYLRALFLIIVKSYSTPLYSCAPFYLPIPLVEGHLGLPYFFTVTNSAAMNIHVPVFAWTCVSLSLGSLGHMVTFSRNCQTVSQRSCTISQFLCILASAGLRLLVFCLLPVFCISFLFPAFLLVTCRLF